MDQKTQEILHQRAIALAKPINELKNGASNLEVVEFSLNDEKYAIESVYIREVYPLRDITYLPNVPDFVYGLINVRRRVISVVNLKALYGLGQHEPNEKNRVLIIENDENEFALLADEIIGIRSLPVKELQLTLPTLSGVRQEFLKGITPHRLVVLDGERLLKSQTLLVEESI